VLNLFAYTCGVGLAAVAGGADTVWNVDFASSALEVGRTNAAANHLEDQRYIQDDVIPVIRQLAGLPMTDRRGGRARPYTRLHARRFDLVVLDPPRWATSKFGAVDLIRDYPALLKPALLATAVGGALLVTNNVASVDRDAWQEVCLRCARKAGRPVHDWTWLPPEADFPSPDGRPPLKMAVVRMER
jgi:23S rRNA (cytosine1962-C5)-methyltransferase